MLWLYITLVAIEAKRAAVREKTEDQPSGVLYLKINIAIKSSMKLS